jgi:hypothetical protein
MKTVIKDALEENKTSKETCVQGDMQTVAKNSKQQHNPSKPADFPGPLHNAAARAAA